MNQINGLYVGTNFVLDSGGRQTDYVYDDYISFKDGSTANLFTGSVDDTNPMSLHALTMYKLKLGKNTFEFGTPNPAPQIKSWPTNKLHLDYPGKVILRSSDSDSITVFENKKCSAEQVSGVVRIVSNNYKQLSFTIFGTTNVSISGIGEDPEEDVLHIAVPANCQITGKCNDLEFTTVENIDLTAQKITGGKVSGKVSMDSESSLTLGIKSAQQIILSSGSSVLAEILESVELLSISTSSSIKLACEKASLIKISGGSCKIAVGTVEELVVESDSSVHVTAVTKISSLKITANSSSVKIEGNLVEFINIPFASSSIGITLTETKVMTLSSGSSVNIKIARGTQSATIVAGSSIGLELAIASAIDLKSGSSVKVLATQYLTKPKVVSGSSQKINTR